MAAEQKLLTGYRVGKENYSYILLQSMTEKTYFTAICHQNFDRLVEGRRAKH